MNQPADLPLAQAAAPQGVFHRMKEAATELHDREQQYMQDLIWAGVRSMVVPIFANTCTKLCKYHDQARLPVDNI
jgi:hypothetical protein